MLDVVGELDRRSQGLHQACGLLRRLRGLKLCEWVDERRQVDLVDEHMCSRSGHEGGQYNQEARE